MKQGKEWNWAVRVVVMCSLLCALFLAVPQEVQAINLATPQLVSAVNDENKVVVTWKKVKNATSYNLYFSTNGGKTWRIVKRGITGARYTVSGGNSGTKYTYTVRAVNGSSISGYSRVGVSVVKLNTPAPTSALNSGNSIKVSWKAVSGAKSYSLYQSINGGKTWTAIARGITGTSYTVSGGKSGTAYTYTVRAVNGSSISDYDHEGVAMVKLATPTVTSATNRGDGVTVSWKIVSGAKNYTLFRSSNGGKTWDTLQRGITGTSYTVSGGKSGTTYTYTVRAVNGSSQSDYSRTGVSALQLTTPDLASAANSGNNVKVSWKPVAGARSYNLYLSRNGGKNWSILRRGITNTSYTISGGTYGGTYTYTVRAVNGSSISDYDHEGVATVKLATPTVTSATNCGDGVAVSWKNVSGAKNYSLFQSTNGGKTWTTFRRGIIGTSYMVENVDSGTTYTYTVRAVNGSSQSDYSRTGVSTLYLATPKLLSAETDGTTKITWQSVSGARGYYVYRKVAGGSWTRIGSTTDTSYQDTSCQAGVTYLYTVRAYSGNTMSYYDTAGIQAIYLAAPEIQSAQVGVDGITITWSAVSEAESYQVYRHSGDGTWTQIGTTKSTNYLDDKELTNGTTYYYAVQAVAGASNGARSEAVSATYRCATLSDTSLELLKTETARLTVSGNYGNVTWKTSNPGVATVEDGTVTAVGIGSARITASVDGKTLTCQVTVASNLSISAETMELVYGETGTLTIQDAVSGAAVSGVTWTSSDPDVVMVSDGQVVTAGIGTAEITAAYLGEQFTCKVTVTSNAALDRESLSLTVGEQSTLTVSDAVGTVIWASEDSSVATVENGVVTAVEAGKTNITASVDHKVLTCTVAVKVDKTGLESVYNEAQSTLSATGIQMYYTSESMEALKRAASAASEVLNDAGAKQSEVVSATTELQTALDNLTGYTYGDGELFYYEDYSKQILEEINAYRVANGLNAYEWTDNYAMSCLDQAAYNAITYLLNYDAYEAYRAGSWDPARHAGSYIGVSFVNYDTSRAAEVAAKAVPTWKSSPGHNANLLDNYAAKLGGVAMCSYTLNGRTVFVCIAVWGDVDSYFTDYAVFNSTPLASYECTLADIHGCKRK